MKKLMSLIFAGLFIFSAFGCQADNTLNAAIPDASENNSVDVTKSVAAKTADAVLKDGGEVSMVSPYKTDAEKFEADDAIVARGKVQSTSYVLDGSTVYTKSEIKIVKCYQGGLQADDVISVREMGGFIPSDVYEDAVYKKKFGTAAPESDEAVKTYDIRIENFKVMEQDEDVILFLVPIKDSSLTEFKTNSYDLIRMWQGKLLYDESYEAYVPYIPAEELSNTVNVNQSAKFSIAKAGNASDCIQARIYTLSEFEAFADETVKK